MIRPLLAIAWCAEPAHPFLGGGLEFGHLQGPDHRLEERDARDARRVPGRVAGSTP